MDLRLIDDVVSVELTFRDGSKRKLTEDELFELFEALVWAVIHGFGRAEE